MAKLTRNPKSTDETEPVELPPAFNPTTPIDADLRPVEEAVELVGSDEFAGLSESSREAARAEALNQRAYRASRDARAQSLAAQQAENRGATIDVKAADDEGLEARREVLAREAAHRKPGLYVRSPILCQDDQGQRLRTPVGMRLTETMISRLGEVEIKKLVRLRRLEDLR